MTEPENANPPPPPRPAGSKWRKHLALGLSAILALLFLFHRPILIAVVHAAAIRAAAKQNIELSFEPAGNFFTGITLKNVRAVPRGNSPVDLISIERVQVSYDFVRLLHNGIRDFVSGYELRNARLILSPFRGTVQQKQELNDVLRDILQQPALFSDRVQVENLNLTVNTPDGAFVLGGVNALLDPIKAGSIRFAELTIPQIASWHDIHTTATYIDRHLIARNFDFGNDIHVVRLELDGSQWAKGISFLSFEGNVLGGDLGLFLWRQQVAQSTTAAQFTASASNLPLERVHDFLRWIPKVSGSVTNATVRLTGNPDNPSSWEGSSTLKADDVSISGIQLDHIAADLEVSEGVARLSGGKISTAGNQLTVQVERRLPESTDELFASGVEAALTLDAPNLSKLHPAISSGTVHGDGRCRLTEKEFTLVLNPTASAIEGTVQGNRVALQSGTGEVRFGYEFRRRPHGTPWFDGMFANAEAGLNAIRLGSYALDSGTLAASMKEGHLKVSSAEFHRGRNTVRFSGGYEIPNTLTPTWNEAKVDLHGEVDAPSLAEFNATPKLTTLNGSVSASGEFQHGENGISGYGTIEGRNLVFREFSAKRLFLNVPVEHNAARQVTLELDINDKDKLTGDGSVNLQAPFGYEARLSGNVRDLSIFQPLTGTPLGGSLEVDWHGAGELQLLRHTGEGRIALRRGRMENFTGIDADVAGVYSPERIDLTTFRIRTNQGAVQAGVRLRDQLLHIDQLRVEAKQIGVVTGTLTLPLDLRTPMQPETVFPATGALTAALKLEPVDLAKVFPAPKPDLAVRGQINASLNAAGTVENPQVTMLIQGRGLQAMAVKKLPPCSANTSLLYRNKRLTVTGAVSQPGISPLQFAAAMPFSPKQFLAERKIAPSTPIAATVKLPPSSAAFLAQFVPEIRYSEGKMSVNASAVGTVGNPVFSGGILMDLAAIRFQNADLPGIGNFHGDLRFAGNQLTFRRFQGDVAGGPFAVAGRVTLEDLLAPQLNLRFRSQGTLLVRNDSLTLRADSDLKISGPLNTAHVTGKVGITKSRFFQEMEILPIGIPGAPAPKTAPGKLSFSLDAPPFREWTFDVSVKTKEPFIIRGNLANGLAIADLHLGGSGLLPTLEGSARVENLVASLPFSKLTVDYGYLYFSADDPFNPTLDIHGSSRLTDYNINVYIYGTAAAPQTVFTSEPSLPQEQVIALLATGATQQEITENNQVLATRAGVLLLQDLYHKVFKQHAPPATSSPDQPLDRFSVDVGTVDPRTGRQEVNGRFKITKQVEISAGLDVQGDVQAQIGYLLRFR